MIPFNPPLFGRDPLIETKFVAFQNVNASGAPVPSALGAQAGDIAICVGTNSIGINSGSGEAWASLAVANNGYWKVLKPADIGVAITNKGSTGFELIIYRGPKTLAIVSSDSGSSGGASGRSAPGFTRSANHLGILVDIFNGASPSQSVSSPTTFTARNLTANSGHFFLERFEPPNPTYPNGTPIVWSASNSSSTTPFFYAFELRA